MLSLFGIINTSQETKHTTYCREHELFEIYEEIFTTPKNIPSNQYRTRRNLYMYFLLYTSLY
jgi:hypothetical protein